MRPTNPRWQTVAMLKKSKNHHIYLAQWYALASTTNWLLKFPEFKNARWQTTTFLKNQKSPYLCNHLTDFNKIWHGLQSLLSCSETKCTIALRIYALIAPLISPRRVKRWWKIGPVVFELKWARIWKLCCDSAEISRFSFIWHTGVLQRIGILQFWF